jgi:hypothetical protein
MIMKKNQQDSQSKDTSIENNKDFVKTPLADVKNTD